MSVIKWKENGVWKEIATIKGDKGDKGSKGDTGEKGDTGAGVPTGGTTGQVLIKKSNANYDTEWSSSGGGTKNHNELNNLDYANSGHTGFQATIDDLSTIRSGAGAGATAVQDNDYVHTDNNYTTSDKTKLAGLNNYDDTEVRGLIANKEDIFRYSTMPTASASNVGNIVEYIGTTDSNYTKGYFYENINTEVQESITASQTDNGVPLGTITVDSNTFKSQASAGTTEFIFKGYNTKLVYMNISTFPPVTINVTRDDTFDRVPMIPGASGMYSWVDGENNFYVTDTKNPSAGTKLYSYDVRTEETTDTGANFIISNTPSQIDGRWYLNENDIITPVELSDYGILLSSSGLPGNTIQVVYTPYSNTYNWTQKNVQPSSGSGTSDYTDLTNKPKINSVELNGNKSLNDLGIINFSGNYNDLTNKPTIPTVDVNKSYVDTELAKKQDIIQYETMPTTSSSLEGKIVQYIGETTSTYEQGMFYICSRIGTSSMYSWQEISLSVKQYDTMPTASALFLSNIVQYSGSTTSTYTKGYFYECIGNPMSGYTWGQIDVQPHQNISGKEDILNKVTSINSSSTDTQYPSAKCVYDLVGNIETLLGGI